MAREFDLLGDPIPKGHGKAGAPEHRVTSENINKIRLLVLAKWIAKDIADEIGISVPSLNKHYFKNGSIKAARARSMAEVKGRVLLQLQKEADGGSVSAQKEIWKIVEKEELLALSNSLPERARSKKPKGKKQNDYDRALGVATSGRFFPDYASGKKH